MTLTTPSEDKTAPVLLLRARVLDSDPPSTDDSETGAVTFASAEDELEDKLLDTSAVIFPST